MKKAHLICLIYLVVGIVLLTIVNAISPQDFWGRYRTPEYARMTSKYYDNTQTMICTVKNDDRYLDFLLDNSGRLYSITIKRKNAMFGERYSVNTYASCDLDIEIRNHMDYYNKNGKFTGKAALIFLHQNIKMYIGLYWIQPVKWKKKTCLHMNLPLIKSNIFCISKTNFRAMIHTFTAAPKQVRLFL